jgi:hypothetical protein
MLDPARDGKLGRKGQAMRHVPSHTDGLRLGDAPTGEPARYQQGKLFDRMTLYMAMMFLGHTLLILALVKL